MSMYLLLRFQVHTVACCIAPAAEREDFLETSQGRVCVISDMYLADCCGPVYTLMCRTLQVLAFVL